MNNDPRVLPRLASQALERALRVWPVVVLMGARQTGKSTLVRSLPALSHHDYVSLDDLDVRLMAREDPRSLVRRSPRIIIDEVQREADLLLAIKQAVDESPRRELGRFVLTGSANLLLMRRVSESLAGRAGYLTLWPMTRREMAGRGTAGDWQLLLDLPPGEWRAALRSAGSDPADWEALARVGGYPVPALELDGDDERSQWFEGYVRTYLERDLQDLSAIDSLADFRRLMRAAALRVGTLESQSEIARDIGVPRPTVHRWLNLLVTSYQLVRVEPYSVNRTKRLVKSPKLHWSDTGLALALGGSSRTGAHLENLVLTDLLAWREAHVKRPEILYWRTHAGAEVDFVIEHDGVLLPIEVKATRRPRPADIRHLRLFREEYGTRVPGALLLYCGDEVAWLAEDVLAAPWWRVL